MKSILISLFLFASLNADMALSNDDNKKHFAISYACGALGEMMVHSLELEGVEKVLYGTMIGTIPGIAKEVLDDKFDNHDLAYDILGSFSGALSAYYFTNWIVEPTPKNLKVSYVIRF